MKLEAEKILWHKSLYGNEIKKIIIIIIIDLSQPSVLVNYTARSALLKSLYVHHIPQISSYLLCVASMTEMHTSPTQPTVALKSHHVQFFDNANCQCVSSPVTI
jgi:hypothetical protein